MQIHWTTQRRFCEAFQKQATSHLNPLKLILPEIITPYLFKGQAGLFKGTELDRPVRTAFEKIGLFVAKETFRQLEKIKTLFLSPECGTLVLKQLAESLAL